MLVLGAAKQLSWYQRFSCLLAAAMHAVPIVLVWAHWEDSRFTVPSSPGSQVVSVHLGASLPSKSALDTGGAFPPATTDEKNSQPLSSIDDIEQAADGRVDRSDLRPIYYPASELDVRPHPESAVIIPFPDTAHEEDKSQAILVLYIDMGGQVSRIEIQESTLPPALEQVAMTSFMQARMRPGMKEGQAVHSKMKVLVEFEVHK